jgi:hypothetical protein
MSANLNIAADQQQAHVYRIKLRWPLLIFFSAVFLLFAADAVFGSGWWYSWAMMLISARGLYTYWQEQLVISPEGVMYDSGQFYRIRTTWENISGIYHHKWLHRDFLLLRNRGVEGSPLMTFGINKLARLIPLTRFGRRWREGPIGADIARFAPQLFEQQIFTTIPSESNNSL